MSAVRRPATLADVVNKMGRELLTMAEEDRRSVLAVLCDLAKFWPVKGEIPATLSRALETAADAWQPSGLAEVQAFWLSQNLAGDPDSFFYFWAKRQWRDKAGPIRNWRMAARGWARKETGSQKVTDARREAYR